MTLFTGAFTAIITPFKNGAIDEEALRKLIDWQIESGVDGIVPCGTTGEAATMNDEEIERVVRIAVEQSAKRVPVLAGSGSNNTAHAIHLTNMVEKAGADGTLQITPYYNKPTQEGLFQHFSAIAAKTKLPVVLYNVPGRTSVNMLPATVARLAKIQNIIGLKDAAGNLDQTMETLNLVGDNFTILSGEDAINFPLYEIGVKGCISVTSNVAPKDVSRVYDLFHSGEHEAAKRLHLNLLNLNKAMFFETNPIPAKTSLSLMGRCTPEFRLPLCSMSPETLKKLVDVLKGYNLV